MSDFRLKCTKFDYRWGSVPDPVGGSLQLQRSPNPLAVFEGAEINVKEEGGKRLGGRWKGKGRSTLLSPLQSLFAIANGATRPPTPNIFSGYANAYFTNLGFTRAPMYSC